MNVSDISKENCCGCTACMAICPVNAIKMHRDEQGFLYPVVDEKLCIKCGKCKKVCLASNTNDNQASKVYAVKHKERDTRMHSSSGGVSSALCENIINDGGVVYGVAYKDIKHVVVKRAETLLDCTEFRGSKYVQASVGDEFSYVKNDLNNNRKVLFTATSCHVNGLLSFLNETRTNIKNLITVDLVCHGVPSPGIFEAYIDFISKKKKIDKFEFRTKYKGWGDGSRSFCPCITYSDGKVEKNSQKAWIYTYLFFSNNCLRPYCYNCPYTSKSKPADITIADYWGLNNEHPQFFDPYGVSLVMINTKKGNQIFKELDNINYIESTYEKASKKQGNLNKPSKKSTCYDKFWDDYYNHNFEYIAKKYGYYNLKSTLIRRLSQSKFYDIYKKFRNKR